MRKSCGLTLIFLSIATSGCVEFGCYSNSDYAKNQAIEFCRIGNQNEQLCRSLNLEGSACWIVENKDNACVPLGRLIEKFVAMHNHECINRSEKVCRAREYCAWTFLDPVGSKFGDFFGLRKKVVKE